MSHTAHPHQTTLAVPAYADHTACDQAGQAAIDRQSDLHEALGLRPGTLPAQMLRPADDLSDRELHDVATWIAAGISIDETSSQADLVCADVLRTLAARYADLAREVAF